MNYHSPRPGGRIDRQDGGVSFLNNQDGEQSNRSSGRGGGRHSHGRGWGWGSGQGRGGRGQQQYTHENIHTQEDDEGEYEDKVISSEDVISYLSVNNIGQKVTMVNGQHNLPNTWLLLDSCSTANLITNKALLHDIHTVDTSISICCNAGTITTNQKVYLSDYPTPVWYNPRGIANILSMQDVAQHY